MQNQSQPPKSETFTPSRGATAPQSTSKVPQKPRDREALAFWGLLAFVLFELILVTVVLVRALWVPKTPEAPLDNGTVTAGDEPTPTPSTPVFAGGAVPTRPATTENTKNLTSEIDSQYAILINAATGEILAQKGANVQFSPASMTKVMTLIVACENLTEADLERRMTLTEDIVKHVTSGNYKDTTCALPHGADYIGDEYRMKDLLYGIGVMSAADCTYMIAKEVGGSEEGFVDLMNRKAQALGISETTHFDNAVGYDSENNVTTAQDMAVIMAYAMQCELIADILTPRDDLYPIKAYYKDDLGAEQSYDVWLKCSFISRENAQKITLSTVTLNATKTGYTTESFIVCSAKGKQSKQQYILVLGNATSVHTSMTAKFKATMTDIETLYNSYAS